MCRSAAVFERGRADDSTWSPLEYACHVRDVFQRYDQRIELMQREDDPQFPNWDHDASAIRDRYDEQDPAHVVDEPGVAAETLAQRLEGLRVGGDPAAAATRSG